MECFTCKKHISQFGNCMEGKKNCLLYDEEPRGKMIRTTITFNMDCSVETPIIKYGAKVIFVDDNGKEVEMIIIKINWINLDRMTCNVDVNYHENEMPIFEKKKRFKIVK